MSTPIPTSPRLRFGAFELDSSSGQLRKNSILMRLSPQPFRLLQLLAERAGTVVSREEIRTTLWTDSTFVDFEHGINFSINQIRAALADNAEKPRYIETLPRRGYRFIAEIDAPVSPRPVLTDRPSVSLADTPPRRRETITEHSSSADGMPIHSIRRVLAISLILAILLVGSIFYLKRNSPVRNASATRVQSLAVLPLENLSSNSEEAYFADGMTDELITNLAKINSLRVISRTSVMRYRNARKSIPEIARELGVDAVVEGTVLRTGGKVRVTAQLIDGTSDRHLWADEYERETPDVLTMQSEIARDIAGSIHARLTPREQSALSGARKIDPAVEDLYWKGVYFLNKATFPDIDRAEAFFNQMLKADPLNAKAWTGVAMAAHNRAMLNVFDDFPSAKTAALKAISLDDSLAEAHAELGMVYFEYDWDIPQAEQQFRRAIDLNPNYSRTHVYYAMMLVHIGRTDQATTEIESAKRLDPLSPFTNTQVGHVYMCARRYDDAIQALQFALVLDSGYSIAHWLLGRTLELKGDYERAIEEFDRSSQIDTSWAEGQGRFQRLKAAYAARGERGYWRELLLIALNGRRPNDHYGTTDIAQIYMRLGDREHAIEWLEKGYAVHDPFLIYWLPIEPEFDPIRSDPRVVRLTRDLGIPSPQQSKSWLSSTSPTIVTWEMKFIVKPRLLAFASWRNKTWVVRRSSGLNCVQNGYPFLYSPQNKLALFSSLAT